MEKYLKRRMSGWIKEDRSIKYNQVNQTKFAYAELSSEQKNQEEIGKRKSGVTKINLKY